MTIKIQKEKKRKIRITHTYTQWKETDINNFRKNLNFKRIDLINNAHEKEQLNHVNEIGNRSIVSAFSSRSNSGRIRFFALNW